MNCPDVTLEMRKKSFVPRCLYKYVQCFFILFMFVFITVLHTLSISAVYVYVCYVSVA